VSASVALVAFMSCSKGATTRSSSQSNECSDHLPESFAELVSGWFKEAVDAGSQHIYLGWTRAWRRTAICTARQLRDMKGSVLVELMSPVIFSFYAGIADGPWPGLTPRSGDAVALAGVSGEERKGSSPIGTDFCDRYATM